MHVVPLPGGEFNATHLAVQAYATTLLDYMGAGMLVVLQYVGEGHVAFGTTAIDGNSEENNMLHQVCIGLKSSGTYSATGACSTTKCMARNLRPFSSAVQPSMGHL